MTDLPTFDEMVLLAKNDPDKLEALREVAIEQTINQASEANRECLRALQHRVDQTRSRASNPYQSMVEISRMMHDKLNLLNTALNRPGELNHGKVVTLATARTKSAVNT